MPTTITFTFQDLLLFILWGLICAVFVLLIMILIRAYKTVKTLQKTVSDNRTHIDKTIEVVPRLTGSVEKIADEVAHDIAAFRPTVDNISETSSNVTGKLNENSGLVSGIGSFVHTISIGKALYDKYFLQSKAGKAAKATLTDVKDAIYDVGNTVRELEKEQAEKQQKGKKGKAKVEKVVKVEKVERAEKSEPVKTEVVVEKSAPAEEAKQDETK